MKFYEQPALELIKFSAMDAIMASALTPDPVSTGNDDPMQGL